MNRNRKIRRSVLALAACVLWAAQSLAGDFAKRAPYGGVRWVGETQPEVLISDTWYALRAIDDVPVSDIVGFAQAAYNTQWKKRFEEDLVQVLSEMGHAPGDTVSLAISMLGGGGERVLTAVPMTAENRTRIWRSRNAPYVPEAGDQTSSSDLAVAVDAFQEALEARWSYRHANQAEFDGAIARLREKIHQGLSENELGIALQKILALGIDGHAGVSGYDLPSPGCLPFLVEPVGDRFVAFTEDRRDFLVQGHPYLIAIDGRDIGAWCAALRVLVSRGSPQYVRRQSLRHLRALDYARGLMGLPLKETVEVELSTPDGQTALVELSVASRSPRYGIWPARESRRMEGDIGYLRLPRMDDDAVAEIRMWMGRFRDTDGLIVDVRDNGGGSRDALRLLYAYLAAPDVPPRVVNAAAYRLHPDLDAEHLANRYLFRAGDPAWSAAESKAVSAFAANFQAEWTPPEGQFSAFHFMALSSGGDVGAYHYARPVVLLMNEKCFSATDLFLAGLKGLKSVTLLGAASSGGSARSQSVRLGASKLSLRIGTMASFQSDGLLFDGRGIQPDMEVVPEPAYYIGGPDRVLEAALAVLTK